MDFPTILASAVASGCFTLLFGYVAARLALRNWKTAASSEIDRIVVEKVTFLLKALHENPQSFKPIVTGLMADLSKIIELPNLNVGGVEVGAAGLDAMIPHLPRKYRFPAMVVRMFMGDGGKKETEAKHGPFS